MNQRKSSIFWGIVLILAGALFLAQNLGYLDFVTASVWVWIFAIGSLVFFLGYFISGVRNWGLLFPACILAALAFTLFATEQGVESAAIGAPILLAVAAPFVVAFLLSPHENWWALIPAWVMIAISLVTLATEVVAGELIGTIVLWSIALPFLIVFLVKRTERWALIPFFILFVVGIIPALTLAGSEDLVASLIQFAIAAPFFVVYFLNRNNWWALIPAGIMTGIGLGLVVQNLPITQFNPEALMTFTMFLVWALTFFCLWLLRKTQETGWAKWPALGLAILAVGSLAFSGQPAVIFAVLAIAAGIIVIYAGLRPKKTE